MTEMAGVIGFEKSTGKYDVCVWRCVQNRRLRWLVTLREWTRVYGVSRCRAVEVSGSACRGRPKKILEEVIKMDFVMYAGQRYTNSRFEHTPRAGSSVTQLCFRRSCN